MDVAFTALTQKKDFIDMSIRYNQSGLQQYQQVAQHWPVTLLDSKANFICMIMNTHTAEEAFNHCLKHGFIIRKLDSFGLPNAVRITIGKPDQNDGMIACLNQLFNSTS